MAEHKTNQSSHKRYLVTEQQAQVIFEHRLFNLLLAELENENMAKQDAIKMADEHLDIHSTSTKTQTDLRRKKKVVRVTSEQYSRLQANFVGHQ